MSGPNAFGNSTAGSSVPGFSHNGVGNPHAGQSPFVVAGQDVQPAPAAVVNMDEPERVIRRVPLQPLGHIDPDSANGLVSELLRNQHSQSQGQQQSSGQGQAHSEADDDYMMPELLDVSDSSDDDSEEGDEAGDNEQHGSDGDDGPALPRGALSDSLTEGSVPSLHDITDSSDEEDDPEDSSDENEDDDDAEDEDPSAEAHDHAEAVFRAILAPSDLPFPPVPTLLSLPSYRTRPDFLQRINQLLFETGEVNDPARAEELMRGLEPLSAELAARFVRAGGEAMCAVCREDLVPPEPESRTPLTSVPDLSSPLDAEAARSPQAQYLDHRGPPLPFEQRTPPATSADALALPCRHAFHAACLHPWLSRRTTCPSCRLDLDPDSLTLRVGRRRVAPPMPLPADMSPMEQIRSLHSVSRDLDRVAEMLPRIEESMRNLTALANEGIAAASDAPPAEPAQENGPAQEAQAPPPQPSTILRDLLGQEPSDTTTPAPFPPQPSELGAPAPAPPQPSAIAGSLLDNEHLRFMLGALQSQPQGSVPGPAAVPAPAAATQPGAARNPYVFTPMAGPPPRPASEAPAAGRATHPTVGSGGPPSGAAALDRVALLEPLLADVLADITRRNEGTRVLPNNEVVDANSLAARNDRALDELEASVRQLRAALAETDRASAAVGETVRQQQGLVGEAAAGPSTASWPPTASASSSAATAPPPVVDFAPLAVSFGQPAQPAPSAADSGQPPVVRFAWPPAVDRGVPPPRAAPPPGAAERTENQPLRGAMDPRQRLQVRLQQLRDGPPSGTDDLRAAIQGLGLVGPAESAPALPYALATSPAARDAQLDAINAERIAVENQIRAARRMQEGLLARYGPSVPASPPSASVPAAPVSFELPTSPAEYRATGDAQLDALHAERINIENQLQAARRMQHGLLERLQEQHNVLAARAALLAPVLRPAPAPRHSLMLLDPPRRHNGDTVVPRGTGDAPDADAVPPPLEQVEPRPHRRRWVCPAPKGGLSLRAWIEEREQATAGDNQAEGSSCLTLDVPRPREE